MSSDEQLLSRWSGESTVMGKLMGIGRVLAPADPIPLCVTSQFTEAYSRQDGIVVFLDLLSEDMG